ncbi:DNA endonuclease [Thermococcus siculi]|uniref:DNA endonuclease n=1 Tax=Thermococcus siculi TaxID=72803 RepID=A0A2Z2MNQ2_9EURY|nr:LAGLIDADG family homing endonuclease [Thermococcus siculi]ASJ09041.1 DNA endonuclease [Thermococcus siculi]
MRKLKDLSVFELKEIMDYARTLRSEGFSYSAISSRIAETYNVSVSRPTVSRWCKGTHNPFNKINDVDLSPSPALSYVIGVYLGDGSIHNKGNGKYRIKLKVVDREFSEAFYSALQKLGLHPVFGFENDSTRVGRFYVEGSSKALYEFLKNPLESLFRMAELYPAEFLRGFFDSEGFPVVSAGKRFRVHVEAVNSNLKLLEFSKSLLETKFGITSAVFKMYSKGQRVIIRGQEYASNVDMFGLRITKLRDVERFHKEIGFTAERKTQKLQYALSLLECCPSDATRLWKERYIKVGREYRERGKPF